MIDYDAVVKLIDDNEKLRTELESLRKDAERYWWLRGRLSGADWNWDNQGINLVTFEWPSGATISLDLDSCIDAAMKAKP